MTALPTTTDSVVARRFRAPGKVVIVGEYAVLDGAPAIVAAIDRGVQVDVEPALTRIVEAPADDRFVIRALAAINAPAARYKFTDWNPPSTETKAGFGGSAAACVVACLAGLTRRGEGVSAEALVDRAEPVHRAIQGGGSGIDVAASAYGGVIRYQRVGDGPTGPLYRARPAPHVRPVVVWSGSSAATGPRVQQYLAWRDRAAFVDASTAIVDRFADDPVGAVAAAWVALDQMATAAGIAWATPAHAHIHALAARYEGAAKPSGAGGGDIAVAVFPDLDAEDAFVAACRRDGLVVIGVNLASGARAA